MERYIKTLYHNKLISRLFHTSVYCLKRELKECHSVLDLGCGPGSPIKYCDVPYSVGVDAFEPYIKASRNKKIHTRYILSSITTLDFDAVILIGVLEHLNKEEGKMLLEKVESWARKKVIITTPNGFLPQGQINQNPYQVHRSGWTVDEMKKFGYKAYGMAGWHFLRKEKTSQYMEGDGIIFDTIRFRPQAFWLIISELTQAIVYYFPKLAFEVFYVKAINTLC